MYRTIFLFMTVVILSSCGSQNMQNHPAADDLYLSWEFIGNNAEEAYSSAVFILQNKGEQALNSGNWKLYFSQMGKGVLDESVSGKVSIQHLNGDLLCISPLEGFRLDTGEKVRIEYRKPGSLIKEGEAPSGVYVVFGQKEDDAGEAVALKNFEVLPFPDLEKFFPSASGIPLPDAAWIYGQNTGIEEMSVAEIPKIIPGPAVLKSYPGSEILRSGLVIRYHKGLENEAGQLADMLELTMGVRPGMVAGHGMGTNLVNLSLAESLGPEAYHLEVADGAGVHIEGGDAAGVFYGIQSMLALLPVEAWKEPLEKLEINSVNITDSPAFNYRGIMLDVARNYSRPEVVKKLISVMAFYKLNKFHFSITNDEAWRLEIPGLPELTEIGGFRGHTTNSKDWLIPAYGSGPYPDSTRGTGSGFMTREDFIDLLKFAANRHVEIIPEINFPGHARAAVYAMELRYDRLLAEGKEEEAELYRLADPEDKSVYNSAQNYNDNISCVCKEAPFVFFEKVVDELVSMYEDAGLKLALVHTGGDEVPAGSWTGSPICEAFLKSHPEISEPVELQVYFEGRLLEILKKKNLGMAGWEEIALRRDGAGNLVPNPDFSETGMIPFVWNSLGSNLDLGNRMANAGYPVVLCNVENFYLDLAYSHHPAEPGHYWGGFVNTRRAFTFAPFDIFNTTLSDRFRRPYGEEMSFNEFEALLPEARKNIVGFESPLWCETVKGPEMLEYYYLPKMLGLAERAWAGQAEWGSIADKETRIKAINKDWGAFAHTIGYREMRRLDYLFGGYNYRLPPPGALIREGRLHANVDFPGLSIRYTTDGSEPSMDSPLYEGPVEVKGNISLCSFDTRGRSSLITNVQSD